MAKKEIKEIEVVDENPLTEKQKLEALYKELLERNIRSIGDLENQIARLN